MLPNIDKQEVPKLLIPRLIQRLFCTIDSEGEFYLDNVDVGGILPTSVSELAYLAGILNSPVPNLVWRYISKPFQNDYRSANKQFIAPLPIPEATPKQITEVGDRAKELQQLHTRYNEHLQEAANASLTSETSRGFGPTSEEMQMLGKGRLQKNSRHEKKQPGPSNIVKHFWNRTTPKSTHGSVRGQPSLLNSLVENFNSTPTAYR